VIIVCDEGFDPGLITAIRERASVTPRFIKHRRDAEHFNFARMINQGGLSANGQILVFLNDDITNISPGWLSVIRRHLQDPGTGALGAWITESNGHLWHFGFTTQPADGGLPIHSGIDVTSDKRHDAAPPAVATLAVTGALLATRIDAFWKVGGLSRRFPSDQNDVDFCFKLDTLSLPSQAVAAIHATHDHGTSRGRTRNYVAEEEIQRRWQTKLASDPWRNPSIAHETLQPMPDWQHWERQRGVAIPDGYGQELAHQVEGHIVTDATSVQGYEIWPSVRALMLVQPRQLRYL